MASIRGISSNCWIRRFCIILLYTRLLHWAVFGWQWDKRLLHAWFYAIYSGMRELLQSFICTKVLDSDGRRFLWFQLPILHRSCLPGPYISFFHCGVCFTNFLTANIWWIWPPFCHVCKAPQLEQFRCIFVAFRFAKFITSSTGAGCKSEEERHFWSFSAEDNGQEAHYSGE
jgi:hypothetical protein